MNVKRVAILALLTAMALIIHVVETLIPLPIPVPGVKLGLANVVTLFMLFAEHGRFLGKKFTTAEIIAVLLCRILLGALLAGSPMVLIYSISGGVFAIAAQVLVKRFVTVKQIWVCGAFGAVFHNVGQILAAVIITATPAIAAYLPLLIIAGLVSGVLTGIITGLTVTRLKG